MQCLFTVTPLGSFSLPNQFVIFPSGFMQEVEEDKKRAEEEGMALQSRKGKADDLTITISKSTTVSFQHEVTPHGPAVVPDKQLTVPLSGKGCCKPICYFMTYCGLWLAG